MSVQFAKHRWFSGRMLACHAGGPGSIPGRCKSSFLEFGSRFGKNSRSLLGMSTWQTR
ncbi:hypothetical protein K1T71_006528 [Dendrolimus kikuchii]|uniref:Uncharacterized protein n=1 Tax=Dendrolimus kikuchii TaxID=765133 RepID=A0ACC1D1E9_9NEOP|nr:hypothetical protein K1T71_006528 [Dendrolimus kikuchii]